MKTIYNILKEFNQSNSRNYKIDVLNKYKDNELFVKVYQYTYDRVLYTFGISMKNIQLGCEGNNDLNLNDLTPFITRELTGNAAIARLQYIYDNLNKESQFILSRILSRDLQIGVNRKTFNKIIKNGIFELPYMRCALDPKNISFPAILQVKMDGTYRSFIKNGNEIQCYSRSGEQYEYPKLFKDFLNLPDGVYIGELTVKSDTNTTEDRFISNGLLNSLDVPEDLIFYCWDFLTLKEFTSKSDDNYYQRFNNIPETEMIKKVKYVIVQNLNQANEIVNQWISDGLEGGVLKNTNLVFENKTSKYQVKMKKIRDVDVKITGFTQGTGKYKDLFGAITFESSDGKVTGQCSGLSDKLREKINNSKDEYIGKIMTVEANELTKSKYSEIYSLMHPRFICIRDDKTEADDFERIKNIFKGN